MDFQTQLNKLAEIVRRHTHDGNETAKLPIASSTTAGEYDNGNITGTATIDFSKGITQYATMTGNVTLTFINPISGNHYTLHLAGAFTPTFPTGSRFSGNLTQPSTVTALAGRKDIYTLIYSGKEGLYDILQSPNYAIT